MRALDKLPKIGGDAVAKEMSESASVTAEQADRLLTLAETQGTNDEILERLDRDFGSNEKAAEGINRLRELLSVAATAGIDPDRLKLDVSIARGLDYYTGTVYETFLTDLPAIGSVCSGGRYDNLAGLYTKQKLPGVGASLGLDRLIAAMEELDLLEKSTTPAQVLIVQFSGDKLGQYQKMARSLRAGGIAVEVFPEPKKLKQQLQYAEKRGFKVALIAGPDEFDNDVWNVRNLSERSEETSASNQVASSIRSMLG